MDTNAVLDLMWVVICGILVFSCKLVSHVETGFQDQKTLGI
jgi:Amt family ammonium transporter